MSDWGQNPGEGEQEKEGPAGERRPDSPSREEVYTKRSKLRSVACM